MNNYRTIRSYCIAAALFLGCCFVMSCENDLKEVDEMTGRRTAVEEAFQLEVFFSQGGTMKARLRSPYMERYVAKDSPYIEFPRTLHVDFYNDSTNIETKLDAKYAKYKENQRLVFLRDSVVVISVDKQDTLYTSEMWWDQDKQEFYTDKPAQRHQPGGNIFYYKGGFRAAQDLRWIETYNNQGKMLVPANELDMGEAENGMDSLPAVDDR